MKTYTLDEILKMRLSFGVVSDTELQRVNIGFKKVVNTAQYETETFDLSTELHIDKNLTGLQLELVQGLIGSQMEYGVISKLYLRKDISQQELLGKQEEIYTYINTLINKCQQLGQDISFLGME